MDKLLVCIFGKIDDMIEKKILGLLWVLLAAMPFTSCMKDEPLNAECDIEKVTLHCSEPDQVFFNLVDSSKTILYTDSVITFDVRTKAPLSNVRPDFTVTEGATVQQISGPTTDFSEVHEARYRVTSQDGNWHRDYKLVISPAAPSVVSDTLCYDFENFELESVEHKYYIWHNEKFDGTFGTNFSTGNPGFKISMSSAAPLDYPTVPADGIDGKCLVLTTRDTGPFGKMARMPLAAGNFFLGEFDVTSALSDAMAATRFGIPCDKKPVKMIGYYKYTPGAKFQDRSQNIIANRTDSASIYSVMYYNKDASGKSIMLQGDNVLTSSNLVAVAKVPYLPATTEWTPFEVEFIYSKDLDPELLKSMNYSISVVFSSSAAGASFEGAIGSQLHVDKVRLIFESEKE